LLQAVYTIRSERQLMEQLDFNLLFRWFVGLGMDDPVWSPTTFTKNRDRLLDGNIAAAFFEAVLLHADTERLLSDEHFTVDGTLLEAWASHKSFRPRDEPPPPRGSGRNPTVDFHRLRRCNATHQSTTDPDARLYKKARGREARLGYLGHVLMEHRSGLLVDAMLTHADGYAECDAALLLVERRAGAQDITVAGDKAYDQRGCVAGLRALGATPHVAQYTATAHRMSAIDGRTTRHPGYAISQRKRKLVEQAFGWMKTIGGLRKLRHRGGALAEWVFTFTAAAYNIVRMRRLLERTA
jgi:IS5 family transposase